MFRIQCGPFRNSMNVRARAHASVWVCFRSGKCYYCFLLNWFFFTVIQLSRLVPFSIGLSCTSQLPPPNMYCVCVWHYCCCCCCWYFCCFCSHKKPYRSCAAGRHYLYLTKTRSTKLFRRTKRIEFIVVVVRSFAHIGPEKWIVDLKI